MKLTDRARRKLGDLTLIVLALVSTGAAQRDRDPFAGSWVAAERDRGVLITLTIGRESTLVLPGTGPDGRTEALTLELRDLKAVESTATFAVDFPGDEGTAEFEFRIEGEGDRGTLRTLRVDGEAVEPDFPTWTLRKMAEGAPRSTLRPNVMAYLAESLSTDQNRSFGIVAFIAPETRGEMVRVRVPIGELTTRLARSITDARRRRAERKAREHVERELREFLARSPAK